MPLVLLSGYPCSGKTSAAAQLAALLTDAGRDVTVINEESLHLTREDCYSGTSTPPLSVSTRRLHLSRLGAAQLDDVVSMISCPACCI